MSRDKNRDAMLDLLAERATAGLEGDEAAQLAELLEGAAEKDDHFELAAAALELAAPLPEEKMPAAVAQRLHREARRLAAGLPRSNVEKFPLPGGEAWRGAPARKTSAGPGLWQTALPWLVAALFFVAALTGWWKVLILSQRTGPEPRGPVATVVRTPQAARAALLESSAQAARLPWTATGDPAAQGVSGDVVWSPERQAGFLRFQNLPSNDPKVQQYQLWIFDATRDDRFPIDGGVFDVSPGGEVVIPIQPRLPVGKATLFAVTLEKPGGAVVSSRERLVLLAKAI